MKNLKVLETLMAIANKLDERGLCKEANLVSETMLEFIKIKESSDEIMLDELNKIATDLDVKGLKKEADIVDKVIESFAAKGPSATDRGYYGEGYSDTEIVVPGVKEYGASGADGKPSPSLSVGTCPDHRGTRLIHVDDQSYQCPIDGKIYDWKKGFKSADGTVYNGGRVDLQTPANENWTSPPKRWFSGSYGR